MNEDIRHLIESLKRGEHEYPDEKIDMLSAALQEDADMALLISLLRARQYPLREAAVDACSAFPNSELFAELVKIVDDPNVRVRRRLASVGASITSKAMDAALHRLMSDPDYSVRTAALRATRGRIEFNDIQRSILQNDPEEEARVAAAEALGAQESVDCVDALFGALASDGDSDVVMKCAELIERRFGTDRESVEARLPTDASVVIQAERRLKGPGERSCPQLYTWLARQTAGNVDQQTLAQAGVGTDLTALVENASLPRAYGMEDHVRSLIAALRREPRRSIALLGPPGCGKSALVNELVHHLAQRENGGWRVIRISPTDFLMGTKYLGEWETKLRGIIEAVRHPRRVLVVIPHLSELTGVGTTEKSDANVATALGPYLEDGSVVVLGESTEEEFERGLGRHPSMRRLFDRVLVPEAGEEQTRRILAAVRDEAHAAIDDKLLDRIQEASSQFLGYMVRPGNAVTLLRAVIESARQTGRPVTFRDVLDSLSRSTGIPADLLDDSIPLAGAEVRAFFERRIMGQPEAVEAMVDLVTLIKAGLTDPQKPFGVLFFLGPTGVGKTELARALAEFIFGDAARLKRFDMSEFATEIGFLRLIGRPDENGLLTDAVRQHPFSVVLFDEFEKSHVNVFDLCLQIFDAGRLTDGRGRTVDFRRTIVILTSNVLGWPGSAAPMGFGASAEAKPPEPDRDRDMRELLQCFSPEFLNRLDRIVHFRPLSLEVAEQIARREVELVLQRSGIRRRRLAVEIDPAVVTSLVREGYSPQFGARPLKRTVERMLLLPLARAIASGGLTERSLLRLSLRDSRITVTATRPPDDAKIKAPPPERAIRPLREEAERLLQGWAELRSQLQPLVDRKSQLLQRTQDPSFYRDAALRASTFDEIHKLDQFLALGVDFETSLNSAIERLMEEPPATPAAKTAARRALERLAAELEQLRATSSYRTAEELGDVLVCLTLVQRHGTHQHGVEKLAGMYQGLARLRRYTAEVLGEFHDEGHDRACLMIAGLGAFALFRHEGGLHQIDHRSLRKKPRSGQEERRVDREIVRVETFPAGVEPDRAFRQSVKARVTGLRPVRSRLVSKAAFAVALFHEPSLRSLEIWTAGPRAAALERGIAILYAQVTVGSSEAIGPADQIIRRYNLGTSPRIRDLRTGRSTTHIDRVLKGHLESLFPSDE